MVCYINIFLSDLVLSLSKQTKFPYYYTTFGVSHLHTTTRSNTPPHTKLHINLHYTSYHPTLHNTTHHPTLSISHITHWPRLPSCQSSTPHLVSFILFIPVIRQQLCWRQALNTIHTGECVVSIAPDVTYRNIV